MATFESDSKERDILVYGQDALVIQATLSLKMSWKVLEKVGILMNISTSV